MSASGGKPDARDRSPLSLLLIHSGPGLGISALTMSGSGSYRPAMGLLRGCKRIHRHLGAGVGDREPAMLLRPEGAPVSKHALELLAFRGLLVQDLLKRRAQRF